MNNLDKLGGTHKINAKWTKEMAEELGKFTGLMPFDIVPVQPMNESQCELYYLDIKYDGRDVNYVSPIDKPKHLNRRIFLLG